MTLGKKTLQFLGARTWKTGIAVTLSVFLTGYVPYSLPLLAGVAAVICLQPSISTGLQKGLTRIQGTLLGGVLGLALLYLVGSNPLLMGLGVIVIIYICNRLNWEEAITLGALTVLAIMTQASELALPYAVGRVTSTLIGIGVATAINIAVVPPRHHLAFRTELQGLTASFPSLYQKAVQAYAHNRIEMAQEVLAELEEAQAEVEILQQELEYLEVGAQVRFGSYFEGIRIEEYLLFDRGVHFFSDVMEKLKDVVDVAMRRYERKRRLLQEGKISDPNFLTPEFQSLLTALQELAVMLAELHQYVFQLVGEDETSLLPEIDRRAAAIDDLKNQVRLRLKYWEVEHVRNLDVFFLMSAHRVVFDLEEIAGALTDLVRAVMAKTGGREKEVEIGGENKETREVGKNVF